MKIIRIGPEKKNQQILLLKLLICKLIFLASDNSPGCSQPIK
jgi:hypothetical protein